jgi:hypothetical protein
MPVTTNGVRTLLRVAPTPKDKGLTATFEVTAYDNGLVTLNGRPMGRKQPLPEAEAAIGLLASVESVAAQMSEFYRLVQERQFRGKE